jgi:hypothetical protein
MEIPTANGQPFQEWGHVLQMPGNHMADALAAFQVTAHLQELRADQDPPLALGQVVPDHYVDHAESSSRVTNTTPLAVPGRCRPITRPTTVTARPGSTLARACELRLRSCGLDALAVGQAPAFDHAQAQSNGGLRCQRGFQAAFMGTGMHVQGTNLDRVPTRIHSGRHWLEQLHCSGAICVERASGNPIHWQDAGQVGEAFGQLKFLLIILCAICPEGPIYRGWRLGKGTYPQGNPQNL